MSAQPIPFISRYSRAIDQTWLDRLNAALPDERFVAAKDMQPEDKVKAAFAVVAGPEAEHLMGFSNLVWVHSTWAGVEALVEVLPKSVQVARLIDPKLTARMTEAVLAWTFFLQRDMPVYAAQQRAQIWRQQPYRSPADTQVGVLGLGELGAKAAQRLAANGFQVAGWSRSPKSIPGIDCRHGEAGLSQVLAQADILVCLLPLTPDTRHLLDTTAFAKTRPHCALINFARGPIVSETALLAALHAGNLRHAVLDVFDAEPLPTEHPYWHHPNITVLPHISAVTDPDSATKVVAANIQHWRAAGEMPTLVDRERAY